MAGHTRIVRPREDIWRELEAGATEGLAHPLLGGEVEDAADI